MAPPPVSPVPDDLRDWEPGYDTQTDEPYDEDEARDERSRRGGRVLAAALVVAAVVGAGSGYFTADRSPVPTTQWMSLSLPAGAAGPVLPAVDAQAPAPSALDSVLGPLVGDPKLGGHVTVSVIDVATGDALYGKDPSGPAVPASNAKLPTAAAVLAARGPAYRIPTQVVAGAAPGEVILVGGGDPSLAVGGTGSYPGAARLDKLAEQVTKALNGTPPTRVVVDSSLFTGPTLGPGWYPGDAQAGFIANITALMTDGARQDPKDLDGAAKRFDRPDLAAGQAFARALGLPASAVVVTPGAGANGGQKLGEVQSPPISRLVEIMLQESDNVVAEALARQVALARGKPATFAGAAEATGEALAELGLDISGYGLVDGSGMSHQNKVSAALLAEILRVAAGPDQPALRPLLTGLPVAGYSGTLKDRFRLAANGSAASGVIRAKTGTLNGISSLAGLVVDADGRLLAFAILADAVGNTNQAQNALDRAAAALATCGC
jgi:D-alanyl-D-alanine carboxypeptidase/D-alanyl-D-alanine-endopeptidase (penicillin-binding protein 4)